MALLKKQEFVDLLLTKALFEFNCSQDSKAQDEAFFNAIGDLIICYKHRYLNPRGTVPKSKDWFIHVLPHYSEERFKSCLKVTRDQFKIVLELLEASHVFKQLKSKRKCSTEVQLAVALFRFGHDGSGASYVRAAQLFGISEAGMVQKCTERVIEVLLSLERTYVKWPSHAERTQICDSMEDKLPGCVGYIDGTHIPLYEAPIDNHEAYFSRKQEYGIQVQAICDNDLQFRNVFLGFPASAHDARVFNNSLFGQHPEKYLSVGEWIAGDSAYKLSNFVVTPFRENARVGRKRQRRSFNRHFSSYRVKIEHAFGILKKVFGSLRKLRVKVDKSEGHKLACRWIMACIVLYNIVRPQTNETIEDHECKDVSEQTCSNEVDCSRRNELFNWFIRERY